MPKVSICVLTFGEYPHLARRVLDSIRSNCPRREYELIVGANAVCEETAEYLRQLERYGAIDHLIFSVLNLNKNPMMRQMFQHVQTDLIWWFDDDSYIVDEGAFERWLAAAQAAPENTVMWGQIAWCNYAGAFAPNLPDAVAFVRSAIWYRGLPPPSWKPGGKGEFDYRGQGTGNGNWGFLVGGCWLLRTSVIRALDWPDKRLLRNGEDVFLGEAIRQQGWKIAHLDKLGVCINTEKRRGTSDAVKTFRLELADF
jgi:GT2 family glycosyltransferase